MRAIATRLSFLGLVAIISGKNLYKSGRDTSLISSVLAMISTEITMIMAIHVTFGSIVYGLLNRLSVQYPLPLKFIRRFDREKLSALALKLNQVTSTWASTMAWYWALNAFLKVFTKIFVHLVISNISNKAWHF